MEQKKYEHRHKILVADDSEMNRFMLRNMLEESYDIIEAEDGLQAVAVLNKMGPEISLVLLDIVMPNMDGFGVLAAMNKYHWIEDVPVIMISAENTKVYIERAYDLGVTDYISRPFDIMVVRRRVINTIMLYAKQKRLVSMVADQIYEREKGNNLMVAILSHIVEFRNGESGLHVLHIHVITEMLLKRLAQKTDQYDLSLSDINLISTASALHDIGKIGVPEAVLNKPGKFTDEEFAIMKGHSKMGADMLKDLPIKDEPLVKYAYEICRWHHERYDGRGYPDGLAGEDIPISAQVVALADVYDALTSERCYKKAFPHEKALEMITHGECGAFQPLLLECLLEIADSLQEELAVRSVTMNDYQAMENVAAEMLQNKDLSGTDRTLRMLEHERMKYQFFASMSQEIQFEFSLTPPMLTISEWGAQRLGLDENIVDPYGNARVLELTGADRLEHLARIVRQTTPEQPASECECQIIINGEPRWHRIIFRSMWTTERPVQYIGVIGKVLDIHEERSRLMELEHQATHDGLTGLLNHRAARQTIADKLRDESSQEFAMVMLDLDYFKQANDQRGHQFGDRVLRHTAQKLCQSIRWNDVAARVGGDEFLVLLECSGDPESVVDRIFQAVRGEYEGFPISPSMGVAETRSGGRDYEQLLHRADQALYSVKRNGRGHYRFYDNSMEEMLSVLSPIDNAGEESL